MSPVQCKTGDPPGMRPEFVRGIGMTAWTRMGRTRMGLQQVPSDPDEGDLPGAGMGYCAL